MAQARRELGLSQVQVARRLRVSQPAVSAWETNRSLPLRGAIQAVADVYGIPVTEFIS